MWTELRRNRETGRVKSGFHAVRRVPNGGRRPLLSKRDAIVPVDSVCLCHTTSVLKALSVK